MAGASDRRRPAPDPWDIGFGVAALAVALLALLVWFPLDIKGGFVVTNRAGKLEPGDAFFPVLLAGALLALSVVQLLGAALGRTRRAPDLPAAELTARNLRFLALFFAVVLAGLAVMYWLGPLTTGMLRGLGLIEQSYRQLVDTAPYKYLGYLAGGFLMTTGLIAWTEGGLRRRALLSVVAVLAASVLIFDVLLENVPLPPNADF